MRKHWQRLSRWNLDAGLVDFGSCMRPEREYDAKQPERGSVLPETGDEE